MEYRKFATFIDSVQYGYTADKTSTVEGDAKYLRITDIVPYFVDKDRVPFCEIDNKNKEKYLVSENDLLIARTGATTGYNLIVPKGFENYIFASYLVRFNYRQNELYPQYLKHVLKSQQYYGFVKNFIGGSAQPGMNPKTFGKFEVPYMEYDTQKKIANILSTYDNLIENNNKRIAVLEQMAENLYKEWFVRLRFPGYKNAEFENGIPKDWKYMKLNKVLAVFYGKDHSKLEDGDIPVYGSGGIMRYGNRALYEDESVLIPRKGSLNNIMWVNQPFWTVDTMFYTKALIPNVEKYIYYVLSSLDMASFNTGAALPSMTTDILYHLKIVVPSETLLARFDETVSELYKQRTLLEIKNNNLIKQRDLLLPRLMSGKLEV